MTSEAPAECFVYITLPGQTAPVTAGRFVLGRDRRDVTEGRFVYGRSYMERPNAVALDPVELKLVPRTYSTLTLGGLFGALRDASPDYWGRRVIQRHLGKAQPGEMEYLLYSPDDRASATHRRADEHQVFDLPPGIGTGCDRRGLLVNDDRVGDGLQFREVDRLVERALRRRRNLIQAEAECARPVVR